MRRLIASDTPPGEAASSRATARTPAKGSGQAMSAAMDTPRDHLTSQRADSPRRGSPADSGNVGVDPNTLGRELEVTGQIEPAAPDRIQLGTPGLGEAVSLDDVKTAITRGAYSRDNSDRSQTQAVEHHRVCRRNRVEPEMFERFDHCVGTIVSRHLEIMA